ncbi:MAG: hypothetical protein M1484_04660 [Patescibacteria group bacterium]|nr:hypothetical protein [Patescibacteria group bacterium]
MNNDDQIKQLAFFFDKLLIAKCLILEEDNFFTLFDTFIEKYNLDESQVNEIRMLEKKDKKELSKLLERDLKAFRSGAYAKLVTNPALIRYSYQHQKNIFIDHIGEYLKRYGMKVPLHPEKDTQLFGEDTDRITFVETLLALELEGLIEVLSLRLGTSKPHEVTTFPLSPVTSLLGRDAHQNAFTTHKVPIVTIQITKRLIALIEPHLSYISHKLSFKGKEVFIPDGFQDSICRTLLKSTKSMKKEWSWMDVLDQREGTEGTYKDDDWRKVYGAGLEINKKVAIETGIKDLLDVNKKTIRVTPKYLPFPEK